MRGFLLVMILSSLFTCAANTRQMLASAGLRPDWAGWVAGPAFAAGAAALAGWGLRRALAVPLAGSRWMQLAAVAAGGAGMCAVCLAAGWPLGLGAELREGLPAPPRRQGKPEENRKVLDTGCETEYNIGCVSAGESDLPPAGCQ